MRVVLPAPLGKSPLAVAVDFIEPVEAPLRILVPGMLEDGDEDLQRSWKSATAVSARSLSCYYSLQELIEARMETAGRR